MSRLPQVNSDKGNWGKILNTWLKHIAGYRGVAPARPASGSLPAGVAINGTGYDTTDQYQSENSGLNFHNDFPANVSDGFTFIHTVHNRIYRREGNDWAVLLEGYTPQSGEHLWRRVATGSPNIRNVPVDGFVGINTDPDYRLHVLENRNDTIALFEGGSNNDIAEVKIFNSNVRSRSRPGGGTIVGGDALLTFETTNNAVWSVGITADYNNDSQRDNFFVISVNNRFGPYSQNDPADDYLIITPNNGAVGIGNNYVPNTNLPPSATLPNNGFYKLDVQGNANVWEQTTTRNFRMWDQNPQVNSLLTSVDTQGNAVWRDFVTLGLVTNAENIPINNTPATDHGWSFAQKVGTVLQFRKITAENQNHGTLFRVRTDGDLIRIGLTGGNNGDIIWRNRNTGVYEWTNPSSIRDALGLGTLTVGPSAASAGVIQVNPNSFNPAQTGNQNINIGFTGGSDGQFLTVNNGTYQWASAQTLNLVTNAENIPQSAVNDPNNHGLSYFGKNGTILQFRAIQGENLIRARTDNQLIRVGLTGGQGNQPQMIVYNFNNSGTYTWQNIPNIRSLLGLGTLTVGPLSSSAGVIQVSPNSFDPATSGNQNINIGFTGGSDGQFLTVNNGTYQWASFGTLTLNNTTPNYLTISPNTYNPNSNQTINIGLNVSNIIGQASDADWFVAGTNNIPQNINDSIWTNGRVGIGTSSPRSEALIPNSTYVQTSFGPVRLEVRDGVLVPDSNNINYFGYFNKSGMSIAYLNEDNYKSIGHFYCGNYTSRVVSSHCVAIFMASGFRRPGEEQINIPPDMNPAIVPYSTLNDNGTINEPTSVPTNFEIHVDSHYRGNNVYFNNRPVKRIFIVTDSGDVWIGGVNTDDPDPLKRLGGRLSVTRQLRIGEIPQVNSATSVLTTDANGWVRRVPVSGLSSSSDIKCKKNIQKIKNVLDKIKLMKGVTFYWKDQSKGEEKQIGLIAQDVEKAFPEAVKRDADGYLSVNYNGLVGVTVEAIKEQQQMIEELQKTVAQQQQLIDLQNQKISQLEQKLEELANKLGS